MNDNDKSRYFGAPSAPHTFNCFTQEQVKEINKEINKNILKKEDKLLSAYDGVVDGVDTTKLGEFFNVPCLPLMKLIYPWLYQCQTLNTAIFGYDINWQFHVEGMNYNIYGKNGKYGWHIDASTNLLSDMKLTCLLNLSEEPYEGGEFCMINIKEK